MMVINIFIIITNDGNYLYLCSNDDNYLSNNYS